MRASSMDSWLSCLTMELNRNVGMEQEALARQVEPLASGESATKLT